MVVGPKDLASERFITAIATNVETDMTGAANQALASLLTLSDTQPIFGGNTAVTLTSAPTLQSLGVTATSLGSATLDTSGADPVADFPITGGTQGPGSGVDVILHQGSGLELADSAGRVDLQDLRIDTQNKVVDANVSVNGRSAGNVAVFDIGADGSTLTLTSQAAGVVDTALDTTAITSDVKIGTAAPSPVINPLSLGISFDSFKRFLSASDSHTPSSSGTQAIIGGNTAVTLTSAPTLQSLGVNATSLGSATLDTSGVDPVANFPITGGTQGPGSGVDVILHQGSGLELADSAGTLDLKDFLIDTQNGVVDANVTANGKYAGNVAAFNIASDGSTLTLTPAAAGVADQVLGTSALTSSVVIGSAAPSPFTLPGGIV
jgi:phage gp45-like